MVSMGKAISVLLCCLALCTGCATDLLVTQGATSVNRKEEIDKQVKEREKQVEERLKSLEKDLQDKTKEYDQ